MGIYEKLKKDVAYAKQSYSIVLLYQAHGAIEMAFDLGAIDLNQMRELEKECVRNGINNPEIFNRKENKNEYSRINKEKA